MSTVRSKPTEAQLEKLPVWAKDYIKSLETERFVAVRDAYSAADRTTPSPFFFQTHECLGEDASGNPASGPQQLKHYIQNDSVEIVHGGVHLRVSLEEPGRNQGDAIRLSWSPESDNFVEEVAMVPNSLNCVLLKNARNLRTRK